MHTPSEDAAGVAVGDGAAPAAPAIEAVPCEGGAPGDMDIISSAGPHTIQIHFPAARWAEFTAAVKAGKYDGAGT